ncbi:hypothetical protein [Methanobrevibacter sp.]|uniref:hypothetical protein n=1 Tax=Methanobrevibacter sp. TaxID=66852 RepID=UPI00388D69A7
MNNDDVHENIDVTYSFNISESIKPDRRMASKISSWLKANLENLKDDDDNIIFNKVNFGYNEDNLKGFGNKPVCDIYINQVEYTGDFDAHPAESVHSIIIFYLKGTNEKSYYKICELHDYLIQEFIENKSFKFLEDTVRDTIILNSEMIQPNNKKWGVMGALELSHILY